jgi:hypothetical protein
MEPIVDLRNSSDGNLLNNWMLQLMTQMFSFEDKIAVCLHPKDNISGDYLLQRTTESTTKLEPIKVDLNFTNSSLDVDESLKTITASDRLLIQRI